jgi:hypothetical protein
MPIDSTRRFIAKTIVSVSVWQISSALIENAVNQVLETEEDSAGEAAVHLGSQATGFVVAHKTERLTDGLVDKIADRRKARKLAKQAKQDQEVE